MSNIKISFGALSDTIQVQLNKQGFKLGSVEEMRMQSLADSITNLFISGLLTPSQVDSARKKLMKKIGQYAERIEGGE